MGRENLMNVLGNCVKACNFSANACLNQNDIQGMVDCMRATHVCAEVCSALIQLLGMDYDDVTDLVEYCIKVCNACTEECDKHAYEHCQKCAAACRECAAACSNYLK